MNNLGAPEMLEPKLTELLSRLSHMESRVADLELRLKQASSTPAPKNPAPPARPVRIAVMGVRAHGLKHIEGFLAIENCHIHTICEPDGEVAANAIGLVETATGKRPRWVRDVRAALADPTVDVLSIAAPHHWHALAAIWAMQAGKHVYLEKPVSLTMAEGESLVAAAARYRVVVQCGTQLRSNTSLGSAAKYLQAGSLGKVSMVHCITYKPRPPMAPSSAPAVPRDIDYDLWCGPAPVEPISRTRLHYDWHWFWRFGNGALGNNGVHRVDVARIGLGLSGFGDAVLSYGGRFGVPDGGETPNTQVTLHRFGDTWVVHEIMGMPTKTFKKVKNGIIFYGANGDVVYHKGCATLRGKDGADIQVFPGKQENHYRNFIDAVRAKDPSAVTCPIAQGHVSSGLCHLGNISYRLGRPASDDDIAAAVAGLGAPAAVRAILKRMRKHLEANEVTGPMTLGASLQIEPRSGRVLNNEAANGLFSEKYRDGFVVPSPAEISSSQFEKPRPGPALVGV